MRAGDECSLTVVCVSYKRPREVHVLINSFLCQTSQDFILHMIHDGPDEEVETIFESYEQEVGGRFRHTMTPERHNDHGHSLREIGIETARTPYILITNDDNYYAPVMVEICLRVLDSGSDGVLFNMIHNYFGYQTLDVEPKTNHADIGCVMVRTEHARRVGWRDKSFAGDGTYIEDLTALPNFMWTKIPMTLFVHN